MDKFHTSVEIPRVPVHITYHTGFIFIGSCFSEHIAGKLLMLKFPVISNPFGTLYNPLSIATCIDRIAGNKTLEYSDLQFHDGLWFSFYHYTGFSDPDKDKCLRQINESIQTANQHFLKSEFLILTFGSAWAYFRNTNHQLVANCHKLPASEFTKRLLAPQEIIQKYKSLIQHLHDLNPDLKIIFTLSPVRHWADGAINNQRSKSILNYCIHEITGSDTRLFYFPAYEIYMDELRDYRFYAEDMLHPSEQGIHYVWERFFDIWIDDKSKNAALQVESILKDLAHKPVHINSPAYKIFLQKTSSKIELLNKQHPYLNFNDALKMPEKE